MPTKLKTKSKTVDDLLRQQEEPPRKKRRLSITESLSGDEDSASTSDDEASSSREINDGNYLSDSESDDELQKPEAPSQINVEDRLNLFGKRFTSPKRTVAKPSVPPPVSSFASLGISRPLQSALNSMSIKTPTEVQSACIPVLLAGKDCIGNAKTGSGKTIAFALPILQKLSVDPYGIFALVLTPTRELAFQIAEQFAVLGSSLNVRTSVIVGGMDMMAQALELGNRPHVVIATPGRLVDHLRSSSGEWDLSRVKFLVLDEADRLLTETFSSDLGYLFNVLPKERQTCLFTATLTPSIETLAEAPPRPGKQKPFIHRMKATVETVSTLKQHYILVPSHVRESYLFYLLCNPPESTLHMRRAPPEPTKKKSNPVKSKAKKAKVDNADDELEQPPPTIIFCAKPKTAAYLTLLLKTLNIRSTALHSRLTQRERLSSLSLFRASVVPVLVSTDVGARGLDIEEVAMVINWDLPSEPEEYTHRVGRTARAGRGGIAISFVTERDEERVLKIEDRIKTKLEEMTLPEDKVLDKLNAVSTAKRLANMELHDSNFGKREEIHKMKYGTRREGEK
ncbi:ATP-dependent RNA helicase DBP8 [Psilocybe cubensis]|uniref:ATP-dependent RNA helicase DBP8 n=2 Tax=Psilocybe cubensis TaxID=181762 RepID=A0A8H8CL95_PSICU|nr:ATP-dependent RNA helicase DBP8 [Psilocybe cubensis]KAH9482964.1 ATP-dependent RNA helicase DBP8 [Psilocybe cubensis]